ncbi:MAG TPA: hypothetical protein VMR98_06185 [Candidatus Polarisedimenticolaceae bacterium]|nr:hypothetical protein [Candidatus Polarisedimenticolaceae bacterium]
MIDLSSLPVTIKIRVAHSGEMDNFNTAVWTAWRRGDDTFTYREALFTITPLDRGPGGASHTLTGLDATLPDVFSDELEVSGVELTTQIAAADFPVPIGWYNASDPVFSCQVGSAERFEGPMIPVIAEGPRLNETVAFFRKVMSGTAKPTTLY